MCLKITKKEYTKLIEQDLNLLRKCLPDCPENDHIILVLCNSIDMHYPCDGKEPATEASGLSKHEIIESVCDHNYKECEDEICNAVIRCTKCKQLLQTGL